MAEIFATDAQHLQIESIIVFFVALFPMAGALLTAIFSGWSPGYVKMSALASTVITLVSAAVLFILTLFGYMVHFQLPDLAGISISMKADLFGAIFGLFTALIWLVALLASFPYLDGDLKQARYYTFFLISLSGCIGVFLCGDLLSLFIFFEIMTLGAYPLVVHNQNKQALYAGNTYLYLGLIGGLMLLSGIMLLNALIGSVAIEPAAHLLSKNSSYAYLIAFLLIAGFGVKAGMVPLHIWLPQAHPVAPAPASALLSGIMIKTGAYGIIRVVTTIYVPLEINDLHGDWHIAEVLGHSIIWIGIVTMLLAAVMALLQDNAKKLLAYSSVSQMGYILMGVGAAGYLGFDGAMGFGAFSYHIVNHAFFKSGFFILFGIIYSRLHEVDMRKMGFLWNKLPFTFAAFLVCAFGITGIPGFNGYVSKTLLHHAIVEAFEHHHLWDLWLAEKLFVFTSGLTACYIIKIVYSIFLGKNSENKRLLSIDNLQKESWLERSIALFYITFIVLLGLTPDFAINEIIAPMSGIFTYSEYYLKHLTHVNVWNILDLSGILIGLIIGFSLFIFSQRKNLFKLPVPDYVSIEHSLYRPAAAVLNRVFVNIGGTIDDTLNSGFHGSPRILIKTAEGTQLIERKIFTDSGKLINSRVSVIFNGIYKIWIDSIQKVFAFIALFLRRVFITLFKFDYKTRGDERFQVINISNIDFDVYIILIFIGAILATSLLFLL